MKVFKGSILVVILAILAVGGLVFAGLTVSGVLESTEEGNVVSEAIQNIKEKLETVEILPVEEETIVGSVQDLLSMGTSQKCTYIQKEDGIDTEGTIYVANDEVRTEMIINEDSEDPEARMNLIITGDWAYIWTSSQAKGTKVELSVLEGGDGFDASEDIVDLEGEMDMICRPWIKDSSKFDVPSDIEFEDITGMLEGFNDYGVEELKEMENQESEAVGIQMCEMCNTAPTPELKDQCLIDAECE